MDTRYDIYFAGETFENHSPAAVKAALARLFNADEPTLDRLFGGKPQVIKRGCDKATAIKYKQAMEQAGARPIIRESGASEQTRKPTAAEKIAALAAAPDEDRYRSNQSSPPEPGAETVSEDTDQAELSPPGQDVLRPEERQQPVTADIDTSGLEVDRVAQRLSAEAPPPPPAPDTSHLAMGEVGESIPALERGQIPPAPDTSALNLAPEGTDFSDCAPDEPASPDLDLSSMELAPPGSDVLAEQYRKKEHAEAPDTDHIQLED